MFPKLFVMVKETNAIKIFHPVYKSSLKGIDAELHNRFGIIKMAVERMNTPGHW